MAQLLVLIPIAVCGVAAVIDLRTREIPDGLPVALLALSPLEIAFHSESVWWWHLAGGTAALLIGALVAAGDRFGGGDVKLFTAIGCWFGLAAVIPIALWIAIAGLPLAILAKWRDQSDFAYGPAIFIGVLVHGMMPNLLGRVAGF